MNEMQEPFESGTNSNKIIQDHDVNQSGLLERTFRFRDLSEFIALTTRERSRILRAQKEKEEYEKLWKGVKEGCICQQGSVSTINTSSQLYHPYLPFHLDKPRRKLVNYIPTQTSITNNSEETNEIFKKPARIIKDAAPIRRSNRRSGKTKNKMLENESSLNSNQEYKNRSNETQKTVRFDNTDAIDNIDVKNLDDIINTQSIVDYLDLN